MPGTYIKGPALIEGVTTTATAGGTTTLTNASETIQQFTGTLAETVVLPDATTLPIGRSFYIADRSTGVVTVNANGGSQLKLMDPDSENIFKLIDNSTAAGVWDISTGGSGSGSGSGRVNFLTTNNSTFKASTGDWITFDNGAVTAPTTLSGGTPTTITIARGTSFDSKGNLVLNHLGTNGQGEGASVEFPVEPEFRSTMCDIEAVVQSTSGYADDGLQLWIEDVTNGKMIQPVSYLVKASLGSPTKIKAQFQTSATGATYRVGFFCGSTTTTSYSVYIDNVVVGPTVYNYGLVAADWKADTQTPFTMNNFGTISNKEFFYKRIGSDLYFRGTFTTGTPVAGVASITLPFAIDTSKLPTATNAQQVGEAHRIQNSNSGTYDSSQANPWVVFYDGSTSTSLFFAYNESTNQLNKNNGSDISSPSEQISIEFSVPILGWASNVQMSDAADIRRVNMSSQNSSPTVAGFTGADNIKWGAPQEDTHAAYNDSTGEFTVPSSGDYFVDASLDLAMSVATAGQLAELIITVDGVASFGSGYNRVQATNSAPLQSKVSKLVPNLLAGQKISIRINAQYNSVSIDADGNRHHLTIHKILGPSSIAASESISAVYLLQAGQIVSSGDTILFDTKEVDTHNAFDTSTARFTAPVSGLYEVQSHIRFPATATDTNYVYRIWKMGSSYRIIHDSRLNSGLQQGPAINGSGPVALLAGEYFEMKLDQTSGGPLTIGAATGDEEWIYIKKVGPLV